jgi:hypothetical protein
MGRFAYAISFRESVKRPLAFICEAYRRPPEPVIPFTADGDSPPKGELAHLRQGTQPANRAEPATSLDAKCVPAGLLRRTYGFMHPAT